ncbi:hypothetical protein NPIL_478841 [Nephila pilipes]|uniref:Uncharacterized protein n=1 Tax=Nephila pilipes TaxID=299642 RepID=A0A8X6T6L1_NEPPI|nr:hypothetical protein NPIL_478841 [Nephila pilipes]
MATKLETRFPDVTAFTPGKLAAGPPYFSGRDIPVPPTTSKVSLTIAIIKTCARLPILNSSTKRQHRVRRKFRRDSGDAWSFVRWCSYMGKCITFY